MLLNDHLRFENTLSALRECNEALADTDGDLEELRGEEREAAKKLIKLCADIAENYEF